jgi:hypothetical protein
MELGHLQIEMKSGYRKYKELIHVFYVNLTN